MPTEKNPRESLADIITDEELHRGLEMMATPIPFEQLVADGVLKQRGRWWVVLDWSRLPEHARLKVQAVKGDPKTRTTCVQFCRHDTRLLARFCNSKVMPRPSGNTQTEISQT
jgi:hypothetical protein